MSNAAPRPSDYGALEQRVYSTETGLRALGENMSSGFADLRNQISGIAKEFSSSRQPQWQALSVVLVFCTVVGGLAYWPIREQQSDLRITISELSKVVKEVNDAKISRAEFGGRLASNDQRAATLREMYADRFKRIEADVDAQQKALVPRGEHEEHWRGVGSQIANVQRQLDETKAALGNTYGLRDEIQRLQREIEEARKRAATN